MVGGAVVGGGGAVVGGGSVVGANRTSGSVVEVVAAAEGVSEGSVGLRGHLARANRKRQVRCRSRAHQHAQHPLKITGWVCLPSMFKRRYTVPWVPGTGNWSEPKRHRKTKRHGKRHRKNTACTSIAFFLPPFFISLRFPWSGSSCCVSVVVFAGVACVGVVDRGKCVVDRSGSYLY